MSLFSGPEDESKGLTWMRNKLLDKRRSLPNSSSQQRDAITDLVTEIKQRENQLAVDQATSSTSIQVRPGLFWAH